MAWQLHECQEFMNIKLALEVEIAIYRPLLEGKESRLESGMHIETTSGYSGGPRPVQLWLWWRLWLLQPHQHQLHQDHGCEEDWDL